MSHKGWVVVAALAFLLSIGAGLLVSLHPVIPEAEYPAPVEVKDLSGTALYASGEYGFMLMYPESATLTESFPPGYRVGTGWRLGASEDSGGISLVALRAYEVTSENSYPRSYRALVRIGVSTNPDDLASCETARADAGETPLPDRTINGVAWKAFSYEDAAMMQYVKGTLYRAVHGGKCYALEALAEGSSYREDAPSDKDISEAALAAEYEKLDAIVSSFRFVGE